MKKYISVEDLEPHYKRNSLRFKNLIEKAQPMVAVSDIEKLLGKPRCVGHGFIEADLRNLIIPQPKKYGGLTVDGWEQLNKLPYVEIELYNNMSDTHIYFSSVFMDACGEAEEIKSLNPDPEGFYRYHNGGECPLPKNAIVEIERTRLKKAAKYINWFAKFGYRILGVADE